MLDELEGEGRIAFTYAGDNVSGSMRSIAGISSADGRVVGLMPHPGKHATEALTGPSDDGLGLFYSVPRRGAGQGLRCPRWTLPPPLPGWRRSSTPSPSPFHVCETVAGHLRDQGSSNSRRRRRGPESAGSFFVRRGGSIIAMGDPVARTGSPFRIVGGHTGSPNLRVKRHIDRVAAGLATVALEPYGGAWLNSWLDRDLGLSGRVSVLDDSAVVERLVKFDDPAARCRSWPSTSPMTAKA